jgi:dienelactone hydrolase
MTTAPCVLGSVGTFRTLAGRPHSALIGEEIFHLEGYVMNEKYTHWLQGATGGAIVLAIVGFSWGGWVTGGTAKAQADAAAWTALLPVCADAVLADPAAVAELKTKRTTDYDDVVRDHLKTIANRTDMNSTFRRDCGKVIEARMSNTVAK